MEKKELAEAREDLDRFLQGESETIQLHPSQIANYLKTIYHQDKAHFYRILKNIPKDILGEVLLHLPQAMKDDAIEHLSVKELAKAVEEMDSDDATDLVKDIEDVDESLEKAVLKMCTKR